ncbi:MAG: hypothetical protein WDZ59_01195 [Pirellulales bacterium]
MHIVSVPAGAACFRRPLRWLRHQQAWTATCDAAGPVVLVFPGEVAQPDLVTNDGVAISRVRKNRSPVES